MYDISIRYVILASTYYLTLTLKNNNDSVVVYECWPDPTPACFYVEFLNETFII